MRTTTWWLTRTRQQHLFFVFKYPQPIMIIASRILVAPKEAKYRSLAFSFPRVANFPLLSSHDPFHHSVASLQHHYQGIYQRQILREAQQKRHSMWIKKYSLISPFCLDRCGVFKTKDFGDTGITARSIIYQTLRRKIWFTLHVVWKQSGAFNRDHSIIWNSKDKDAEYLSYGSSVSLVMIKS